MYFGKKTYYADKSRKVNKKSIIQRFISFD